MESDREMIEEYHKMKLDDIIDRYATSYGVVYIYGQTCREDFYHMGLMEREIYEFRDKSAQVKLEDRIKEMHEFDKNSTEKCRRMKLEDLFDTYDKLSKQNCFSLNGVYFFSIEREIYDNRDESAKTKFKKIQEIIHRDEKAATLQNKENDDPF